jgi:MFS family permease
MILTLGNVAFPAISSTISESAGGERDRTHAFTMIYTVGPALATMITPAAGGLIADEISLRAVFVAAGLLSSCAVLAFTTIGSRPVPHHASQPATYQDALRLRPVALIAALELATIFILTLGVTLIPNYLQDVHGISTGVIGLFGSFSAVGSIVLGISIARLRPLHRPLNAIGLAVASCGVGLSVLAIGGGVPIFALGYVLRGGFFVAWSLFAAALGQVSSERLRARSFALGELCAGVGYSSAPFVAGWLFDLNPLAPVILAMILSLPLLAAIISVERSVRRRLTTVPLAEAT